VHEDDGAGDHARGPRRGEWRAQGLDVERAHDGALRIEALVGLDHALVQQLGQHDVTSSVRSPLRSSSALVATVVPIFTHSTRSGVISSPGLKASRRRMPSTAASS
jgi:hypothetical protein